MRFIGANVRQSPKGARFYSPVAQPWVVDAKESAKSPNGARFGNHQSP